VRPGRAGRRRARRNEAFLTANGLFIKRSRREIPFHAVRADPLEIALGVRRARRGMRPLNLSAHTTPGCVRTATPKAKDRTARDRAKSTVVTHVSACRPDPPTRLHAFALRVPMSEACRHVVSPQHEPCRRLDAPFEAERLVIVLQRVTGTSAAAAPRSMR